MCGWTLARAHARSGDPIAIGDFSDRYADQNERDYAAVADAAQSGRIEARTDLL